MISDRRPIIGVTGPDHGGEAAWWFTTFAVWLAGGHAVRITPSHPRSINGLDALIIGGGADLDPELYGQDEADLLPRTKPPEESLALFIFELVLFPLIWLARKGSGLVAQSRRDDKRDALEMKLLAEAVDRSLPILGICRGQQLINVYFGGTLHQKLKSFYTEAPEIRTILPRKRITLADGTMLRRVMGTSTRRVNALHHQGIDRLGSALIASARDKNSIIQAIEHQQFPFIIGVQWHPEFLPQLKEQRSLFRALVQYAKRVHTQQPQRVAA